MNFPEVLKSALNNIISFDIDDSDAKKRNEAARSFQSLLSFDLDTLSDEEKDAVKNFISMVVLSVKGFAKGMGIVDSANEPTETEESDEKEEEGSEEDTEEDKEEGESGEDKPEEVGGDVEKPENDTSDNAGLETADDDTKEEDDNKKKYYSSVERYLS